MYSCKYCGKNFKSSNALGGHVNLSHVNPEIRKKAVERSASSEKHKRASRKMMEDFWKDNESKWSDDEVELLKRMYPRHGKDIKKLRRTPEAIRTKARRLGIKLEYCIFCEKYFGSPHKVIGHIGAVHKNRGQAYEKGHRPWNKGLSHSEETREKLRRARVKQNLPKERTSIECLLQKALEDLEIEYKQQYPLEGSRVDFVIPSRKIALFADGCWYHCCPKHYPEAVSEIQKQNLRNDKKVNRRLKERGWKVMRFFGCEIKDGIKRKIQGVMQN